MRARVAPLRLVAATALAGAVALGWAPAAAGTSPESAGTVTFTGGCGLLSTGVGGRATPDAGQVSVPGGASVGFANQLGQTATLQVDGQAIADVPAGGTAQVVFFDGPATASMQISCPLNNPSGTVNIEVVPAPAPTTTKPSPTASPRQSTSPSRSSSDRSPSSPTATSGSGSGSSGQPSTNWSGEATGPTGPGDLYAPPRPDDRPSADAPPEPTPGPDERPDADDLGAWWGDPADGGGQPLDQATVGEQPAEGGLAAEQLSRTAGSVSGGGGPIGLLALIATVCVVGVSAGAIRVLITQRANRAEWA